LREVSQHVAIWPSVLPSLTWWSQPPMSAKATCTPRFALIICANCFRLSPKRPWIVGVGRRRVVRGVGSFQRFDCVEGFLARAVEHAVHRVVVHGFEAVRHGDGVGILSSYRESFRLLTATAGSLPERIRGSDGPNAMARKADLSFPALLGSSCSARFSQPSSVIFMPGVPIPCSPAHRSATAWRRAIRRVHDRKMLLLPERFKDAIADAIRKSRRDRATDFFGMLMVGRMA